jgi:hypothetical protein
MRIAILTNFKSLYAGYSLTSIVLDQIRMLTSYDNEVGLFLDQDFVKDGIPEWLENNPKVKCFWTTPTSPLIDYVKKGELTEEHAAFSIQLKHFYIEQLKDYDIAFTHDFILTGWNLPYAIGIREATPHLPHLRWLDWIHSVPTAGRDWWSIREYTNKHRIVYPNRADSDLVFKQYRGKMSNMRIIPHIKDMRSFLDFSDLTCEFIKDHPGIFEADIVKVYPASSDRLSAKGVDKITLVMAQIKKRKFSVFTVIVNQHANDRSRKEKIDKYERLAKRNGLNPDTEFVFTSTWRPDLDAGVPQRMVAELFQCSNIFLYPTREESFGLIGHEAVLAGGCMVMLNQSLPMMMEVHGGQGMYSEFGSFRAPNWRPPDEVSYYRHIADSILGQWRQNFAIQHKTYVRRRFNWNYIYNRDYLPVMVESENWL